MFRVVLRKRRFFVFELRLLWHADLMFGSSALTISWSWWGGVAGGAMPNQCSQAPMAAVD